jgi:hypothetical protein
MNAADEAFVKRWKATTWAESDNEADVSEDFVTPLLLHLGYSRESVNAVLQYCVASVAADAAGSGVKAAAGVLRSPPKVQCPISVQASHDT